MARSGIKRKDSNGLDQAKAFHGSSV